MGALIAASTTSEFIGVVITGSIVIIALIVSLIMLIYFMFRLSPVEKNRLERNREFNSGLLADLQGTWDFAVSKTVKIPELTAIQKPQKFAPKDYFQIIGFDNAKKKILIVDYVGRTYQIVNFSDIINYEILENTSTSSTTIGSAYGQGGIYSGISSSTTSTGVTQLKLLIRINNFNCPQVVYEFINPKIAINNKDKSYQKLQAEIQNAISLLEIIKKQNETV